MLERLLFAGGRLELFLEWSLKSVMDTIDTIGTLMEWRDKFLRSCSAWSGCR